LFRLLGDERKYLAQKVGIIDGDAGVSHCGELLEWKQLLSHCC
ncbi:MAG: hypothetical protein JWM78_1475, partial [Verrucomicrobiaceae bacterium]|nr:hypothetical protein [Verrucomicrobiaceae bacterium]